MASPTIVNLSERKSSNIQTGKIIVRNGSSGGIFFIDVNRPKTQLNKPTAYIAASSYFGQTQWNHKSRTYK